MADRSPFAPPTIGPAVQPTPPPPPGPKWSDSLSVALVTQRGGVFFATIYDKTKNEHFLLESDRVDNDRQLSVSNVQWGDVIDQTVVKLRHNNDLADIRFDASASTSSPGPSAPMPGRPLSVPTLPPGLQGPPRMTPPPPPPGLPPGVGGPSTVQRRAAPIRTSPTVNAPAIRVPPPNQARRPVAIKDEDDE